MPRPSPRRSAEKNLDRPLICEGSKYLHCESPTEWTPELLRVWDSAFLTRINDLTVSSARFIEGELRKLPDLNPDTLDSLKSTLVQDLVASWVYQIFQLDHVLQLRVRKHPRDPKMMARYFKTKFRRALPELTAWKGEQ